MDSHQQGRPEQGRARAKSGAFSFRSHNSEDNNNGSSKSPKSKHTRKESESERRKTHYDPSTKANPNAAMNEAQPSRSDPVQPVHGEGREHVNGRRCTVERVMMLTSASRRGAREAHAAVPPLLPAQRRRRQPDW